MPDLRRLRLWLRALVRPRTVERELDTELRHHIELETEKNIRAGMEPVRARRKAMIDFGGEERYKEQTRDARATRPLEDVLLDVRYGLRQLRKHPGFTTVALLSLALGIGANTAIFSLANALLIRDLPFRNAEELLDLYTSNPGFSNGPFSYPDYLDVKEGTGSRSSFAGPERSLPVESTTAS